MPIDDIVAVEVTSQEGVEVVQVGAGISGFSGRSGYSGFSGKSGYSGYSGKSGYSGYSSRSGFSGYSGRSGYSGYSGSGVSGYSGFCGKSGFSGFSAVGTSGYSGYSGRSGYSGYSSSVAGTSGFSGYSGFCGLSGYSGFCGLSGYSGYSGPSNAPVNAQPNDYTFVLGDAGKAILHDSATPHTYTIPANGSVGYSLGTIISIINENGSGAITLAITTDTLRRGDGTAGTGSRTIAADSVATIIKSKTTEWFITGKFT